MNQDPYSVELADVAKEVGGNLCIEYHTAKLTIPYETLQEIKGKGFPTDVMSCIMFGLIMNGKTEDEVKSFLKEADEEHAHLSVAFEAPEGEALNVKSKEDNPLLDIFVQAAENDSQI